MLVKLILRKYGELPDQRGKAMQTMLEQAAVLSAVWAAAGKRTRGGRCNRLAHGRGYTIRPSSAVVIEVYGHRDGINGSP